MNPNEDVIRLDCGHYDLESLSYKVSTEENEYIICPRCFSAWDTQEQALYPECKEEHFEHSIREQAARTILFPFTFGIVDKDFEQSDDPLRNIKR